MRASPKTYLVANAVGLLLYTAIVVRIAHKIRAENRGGADFGDGMNFALTAFPVLMAFVAVNLTWIVWSSAQAIRRREYQGVALGAAMIASWVLAVLLLRQIS